MVHAPDVSGEGFFRETICATRRVPASPVGRNTRQMVQVRVADYLHYFAAAGTADFDVWHAQDGISGNVLAALKGDGRIAGFARTVHHVDSFTDPILAAMQRTSITAADALLVVSPLWRDWLETELDRRAAIVGNGVDLGRFATPPDETDTELRAQLALPEGVPVFLSVGGVEARKNTIRILEAFAIARRVHRQARLVIAGGASLLDHGSYQAAFAGALAASGLPEGAVVVTGPLPQRLMPALYRAATLLVFPSVKEGFGLVVLEAMANGVPVLTSRIRPFTDYLDEDDVIWCDPHDTASIADGMTVGMQPAHRARLTERGLARAAAHGWDAVAARHLAAYENLIGFVARGLGPRAYPSRRPDAAVAPQRVGARNKSAHDEGSGTPATPTFVARGLVPRVYPLGHQRMTIKGWPCLK